MAELLLASVPAFGHVKPMLPIARELVCRGHQVRWITGAAFRERVEGTGARFCPMGQALDFSVAANVPETVGEQRRALKGLAQLRFDLDTFFIQPVAGLVEDLLALDAERPADLLLCDTFVMAGGWWAELTGRPWAQLCCSVLTLPSRALAPFGLALPPNDSLLGWMRNALLQQLTRKILFRGLRRSADHGRKLLGLPPCLPWLFDCVSPHLVLVGTTAGFEYPRPDLPPQVHFVGPLLEGSEEPFTPPGWWSDLKGATVVHVSQGTVATDPDQLLRPTIEALRDEPVLVVACTARIDSFGAGLGTALPANVRADRYVPYGALLPRVSVMVSNGGFNGVQAALAAGIPLVTAGSSEDKPEVCARLRRTGASIDLATATPTPAQVRTAVRTLLSDPTYRQAAQRLATEMAAAGGAQRAADLLEALLG